MFKWATLLLAVLVMIACLGAMGVGGRAMAELLLALGGMGGIAVAIAWLFLRNSSQQEIEKDHPSDEPPDSAHSQL
ncbi:MAG: hypothetical protein ACREIC_31410 [Limisphaerales bacterium]